MRTHAFLHILAAGIFAVGLSGPVAAQSAVIDFTSDAWAEQNFLFKRSNDYAIQGSALTIDSRRGVSVLYSLLPESLWRARSAEWDWSVVQSVPATDLTRKGGDDRNIALYFIFLPEQLARETRRSSIRRLLNEPQVRALVYVWGGAHEARAILPSPYMDSRGVTVVQRPAGTGRFMEEIDLAADFQQAFGEAPTALAGIAVSADSDDTRSTVQASIAGLTLR